MSRYSVSPREPIKPAVTITVGWDNPLRTYFAQVWQEPPDSESDDEPQELVWIGTSYDEIQTVEAIAEAIAPWVDLSAELEEKLSADRSLSQNIPPTQSQVQIEQIIKSMNSTNGADSSP